jgi:hypothetical protein
MTSYELPEEHSEFMDAYNGWRWKLVVSTLDEWFRTEIKHYEKEYLQEARDKLSEITGEEGLNIWE